MELHNGETYLIPAFNHPEDPVLLTTKPIASVALNRVATDDGYPGTMRFDTDFKTMAGNEVDGGAGDDTIVGGAGSDTLDATGWNLEQLEITPPSGFVGTMNLEVSVNGLDSGGAAAERLSVFEIEVAPDPEPPADPDAGGGDEDGWVDAADGGGAPGDGDDVMGEDVDFSDDSGVENAGFYSHETQEP